MNVDRRGFISCLIAGIAGALGLKAKSVSLCDRVPTGISMAAVYPADYWRGSFPGLVFECNPKIDIETFMNVQGLTLPKTLEADAIRSLKRGNPRNHSH